MRIILVFVFWAVTATAYAGSLAIGPMWFEIGTSRETVIASANAKFRIVPVEGGTEFFLAEKGDSNSQILGVIEFKAGKLVSVQRSWGHFSGADAAYDAAKALNSALESATKSAGSGATIGVETKRMPGYEFNTTTFRFKGRKVTFSVMDAGSTNGGRQVSVDESIDQ